METRTLPKLLEVGRSLAGDLDLDPLLERVLQVARELTGARFAAVGVMDPSRSSLDRFITSGIDAATHRAIGELPRGHGVLGLLIEEPQPLLLKDVSAHPRSYGFPLNHPPMASFLGVPILVQGQSWGNLYLCEKEDGDFTESDQDAMVVLAEVGDADAALRAVLGHKPDVLVLDLNMPGEPTSLDALPYVAERSPGTRTVVLTMQEDPEFARRALRAGAAAYVLKEAADTELVEAIRRAAAGETYLNPSLGARLAATPEKPSGPPDDLTEREVEVLRLIALGHTNAEIGGQLFLSVRTVETHRAHIQQKLSRSTRAELVRYAIDHELLAH